MSSRSKAWIHPDTVLAIHEAQLEEHGGALGIRNSSMLESALARPRDAAAYDEHLDVPTLATLYGIAIIRNHPFIDGNKRVGFVLLELFLELNGYAFTAPDDEVVRRITALAAGKSRDAEFITWVQVASYKRRTR